MEAAIDYVNNKKFIIVPGYRPEFNILSLLRYSNFAFQIMYLRYKNKQKVMDFIKENNLYQNIQVYPESIEYIDSLPPVIKNMYSLENDGIELIGMLGMTQKHFELKEIEPFHDYFLKFIEKNYPQYKVIFNQFLMIQKNRIISYLLLQISMNLKHV